MAQTRSALTSLVEIEGLLQEVRFALVVAVNLIEQLSQLLAMPLEAIPIAGRDTFHRRHNAVDDLAENQVLALKSSRAIDQVRLALIDDYQITVVLLLEFHDSLEVTPKRLGRESHARNFFVQADVIDLPAERDPQRLLDMLQNLPFDLALSRAS
jgi:hypothetical protein